MPASIVARVVRMPVFAAVVASALAACSNDPLSPVAPQSRISRNASVATGDSASASDVVVPWYRNGRASATVGESASTSDVVVPWYRNSNSTGSASTSDVVVPWYRNGASKSMPTSDVTTSRN